jgi:hypothetical protein
MNRILALFSGALFSLFLVACSSTTEPTPTPDPDPDPTPSVVIGKQTVNGHRMEIYADRPLATGYNKLYFKVIDTVSNQPVANAHIHCAPVMTMTAMTHGAPSEEIVYNSGTKLWEGAVVFTMPTMGAEGWHLEIECHDHMTDEEIPYEFPVSVANSKNCKVVGTSAGPLIISLIPTTWKVGMNDIEFTVHAKAGGDEFPAVTDLTVEMEPTMPSMGHGSPSNVDPTHATIGHYVGDVNYTMSGDWNIRLVVRRNGAELVTVDFLVTVP